MNSVMELFKLHEAAGRIGVSYPTIKQWIYKGKVRSIKTPGGHHRIPRSEIERLTESKVGPSHESLGVESISGRNKLSGTVVEVKFDGLLAQVTIDIGGQRI